MSDNEQESDNDDVDDGIDFDGDGSTHLTAGDRTQYNSLVLCTTNGDEEEKKEQHPG